MSADWEPGDPLYEDWSVDTVRSLVSIQDDHPADKCPPGVDSSCITDGRYGSAARWPDPFPEQDLEEQ